MEKIEKLWGILFRPFDRGIRLIVGESDSSYYVRYSEDLYMPPSCFDKSELRVCSTLGEAIKNYSELIKINYEQIEEWMRRDFPSAFKEGK
jgi:hypothetical protein